MVVKAADLAPWLTLAGAILAAGMWLGALQQRVTQIEFENRYYHGDPVHQQ